MWVYRKTESQLWTVGFYDPTGFWHAHADFDTRGDAAAEVNYLNGGRAPWAPA